MKALRTLLCLVFAAVPALWQPVAAQVPASVPAPRAPYLGDPPRGAWLPGGRSYLGLNLGRSRYSAPCATTSLLCEDKDRPTELYMGTMIGNFWGVEMAYLNTPRIARGGTEARTQGLNLSLVGKARLADSLNVFGRVGTTYGRPDTSVLGASSGAFPSEQGFGLSFGGGLSLDVTPRLSARLEWDSNDLRFSGSGREPVRSTSLGLQYRY